MELSVKRVCFSFLASALLGVSLFGQATPPVTDPKGPAGDPKEKPPETPKLPAEDPLLKEALKHFEKNEGKECMAKLKDATDKNKELQPPEIIFASWLAQSKKGSDARMMLEQFIARKVDHPDGYLLNASFAYGEGRITDAINSCLNALNYARSPQWNTKQQERFFKEARLGLVASLEARGDFGNMVEHLQALVNDDKTNANLRLRLAAVKFNIGQEATALSELEEAYKIDPSIDPPELRMGALWASKAATDLGLKADAKPEEVAEAVKKKIAENRVKAEEKLKEAVKKYGDKTAKAPRGYASFLLEEGKFAEALTLIDQAKAMDEKDPKNNKAEARETTALRALYHRYKAEYNEAVPLFDKLFSANPADPFATGNLAICLMEAGTDNEKAKNLANSLVKSNEKSPEAYAVLGWVLFNAARKETDKKKQDELYELADKALGASASGGQAMLDTAYYLAEFFNYKKEYKKAYDLLKDATNKRGAFVYRKKAETLMNGLEGLAKEDEAKKKAEAEKMK